MNTATQLRAPRCWNLFLSLLVFAVLSKCVNIYNPPTYTHLNTHIHIQVCVFVWCAHVLLSALASFTIYMSSSHRQAALSTALWAVSGQETATPRRTGLERLACTRMSVARYKLHQWQESGSMILSVSEALDESHSATWHICSRPRVSRASASPPPSARTPWQRGRPWFMEGSGEWRDLCEGVSLGLCSLI